MRAKNECSIESLRIVKFVIGIILAPDDVLVKVIIDHPHNKNLNENRHGHLNKSLISFQLRLKSNQSMAEISVENQIWKLAAWTFDRRHILYNCGGAVLMK